MNIRTRTSGIMIPAYVAVTGGGAYHANAVHFDNSSLGTVNFDTLALSGTSGTNTGLLSFWYKQYDTTGTRTINLAYSGANNHIQISISSDFRVVLVLQNAAGGGLLTFYTDVNQIIPVAGWQNIQASWTSDAGGHAWLYINGLNARNTFSTDNAGTIDYPDFGLGGAAFMTGNPWCDIADFYLNINTSLDLSNATNRGLFRNEITGKPVDLGDTGTNPTGGQPLVYLSLRSIEVATPDNFANDKGSGNGFTMSGSNPHLTLAGTSPSD